MLDLWKPILALKDKNNPVVFDITGRRFKDEPINKYINPNVENNHPFVIFYDDKEDCYYYLKARGAWDFKKDKYKPRFNDYELPVFESAEGLFKKRTYVDCSQIFKCNRELLESLVDIDSYLFKLTNTMSKNVIQDIKNLIKNAIFEIPPNISILEIKIDNNGNTYAESLYLSEQKIDRQFEIANILGVDLEEEYEQELLESISKKDDIRVRVRNRYQNGIDFCEMFLNEYFKDDLEKFRAIQEIEQEPELER